MLTVRFLSVVMLFIVTARVLLSALLIVFFVCEYYLLHELVSYHIALGEAMDRDILDVGEDLDRLGKTAFLSVRQVSLRKVSRYDCL